jgi:hypothetical protein
LRLLTLPEHSRRFYRPLDPPTARALAATGLVAVDATHDGRTSLRSRSRIGTVGPASTSVAAPPNRTSATTDEVAAGLVDKIVRSLVSTRRPPTRAATTGVPLVGHDVPNSREFLLVP